ncbi:hypothetical protein CH063_11121 [Colletotrichum higginsianum]|uniref:Uncharacterized protein n=1 Tax=Colletotrichum higginsianum (strain IMI 349063) TaxID=759273 RepID=H1VK41_COLHI|nr:hypothetical protein CH063_11121 [Colletotrichum higginsianum]
MEGRGRYLPKPPALWTSVAMAAPAEPSIGALMMTGALTWGNQETSLERDMFAYCCFLIFYSSADFLNPFWRTGLLLWSL